MINLTQIDQLENKKKPRSASINVGRYGEAVAVKYLISKDYRILASNILLREGDIRGEIDILCIKDNIVHLIEVKTSSFFRSNLDFAILPESNLSRLKIRKLRRLRMILLMRMSEEKISSVISSLRGKYAVSIDGIAVYLFRDVLKGADLKSQIYSIKLKFFSNL